MADAAKVYGTEVYDETENYDRKHGKSTCADTEKPSGLSEASNSPPPQYSPIKITTSK